MIEVLSAYRFLRRMEVGQFLFMWEIATKLSAGCLRGLCALALRCTPSYGPDPRCNTYDCKSGECCHKDSDKDAFPKFIFCLFLFQCLFSFIPGQPDLIR